MSTATNIRRRADVLGSKIDVVSWRQTIDSIMDWAKRRESKYVCACNVHVVVTANRDVRLAAAIENADLATADGMPIAWSIRQAGFREQTRINGPDLMLRSCIRAGQDGVPIFLFGSATSTLAALRAKLLALCPNLRVAGMYSPPFRQFSAAEDAEFAAMINCSGAGIVFVGLGCPKQELWMERQRGNVNAVMIGVGAAFDYHSGTLRRAPVWMQRIGLEWLFRFAAEPRRLWRRYLVTNSLFIAAMTAQLIRAKK